MHLKENRSRNFTLLKVIRENLHRHIQNTHNTQMQHLMAAIQTRKGTDTKLYRLKDRQTQGQTVFYKMSYTDGQTQIVRQQNKNSKNVAATFNGCCLLPPPPTQPTPPSCPNHFGPDAVHTHACRC